LPGEHARIIEAMGWIAPSLTTITQAVDRSSILHASAGLRPDYVLLRMLLEQLDGINRTTQRWVPEATLRRVKYLNNIIEQDHRFIKKRVRACLGYRSFDAAERTLQGVEAVNMMRKGQVKRLAGRDAVGQSKFVASLFQITA
jgi:DDE domain